MSWIEQTGRITWRYVDDPARLREAAEALSGEGLIGLDTETCWDVKSGGQQVSLVQLAPPEGDVLVADMTDPDWEPVMKRVAAIVKGIAEGCVLAGCALVSSTDESHERLR